MVFVLGVVALAAAVTPSRADPASPTTIAPVAPAIRPPSRDTVLVRDFLARRLLDPPPLPAGAPPRPIVSLGLRTITVFGFESVPPDPVARRLPWLLDAPRAGVPSVDGGVEPSEPDGFARAVTAEE